MTNAREETEESDEKQAEEGEKKKKKGEEERKEVKMDLIEIRKPKKGLTDSVRVVSYRRTGDLSEGWKNN